MDVLDLIAAEKNAIYQGIKNYVLQHSGWKIVTAQVKQKRGIIEHVNYHKPRNGGKKQPSVPTG